MSEHARVLSTAAGGVCFLCGGRLTSEYDTTVDHVFPRHLGFSFRNNGLACHRACNASKSSRLPHPCEVLFLSTVVEVVGPAESAPGSGPMLALLAALRRRLAAGHAPVVRRASPWRTRGAMRAPGPV